ncbi:ClpXP protease specificity-enhancing factor [Pasteurella atlantica]|uniref:ClpXP protease specificity-enhancing factor n=2 Tax=Pasteurellaceae TaxID=712 RepID=A0ACC6HNP3_9PAST|nr:ClpXP protease specificity-enhancing factor [Pasteurella atlantica]MDP8033689.1 ClpXP protease specificity-enhancing factor [Pasteurella atlantica]MDP8035531.1 ClpXP protease specificity-enhancing factor [Pasteurella atlantica]MDP8037482.1 ClpXP protease specificity-enhancing factor [Pasteurella atlantica]MDP8047831.1 ClpXP protease specificity-enhancing factor [Pasteurella atlantica]MDP8049786.1 ClpXP protease specificity-enhancing factor [Pasteurella atlantica]
MKPLRPYLYNAYYNWILDSDNTPYLLVNTEYPDVDVPKEFITEGRIILNLSPRSIGQYTIDDEAVSFSTRFNGMLRDLYIPLGSIIALYAQETSEGIMFQEEEYYNEENYTNRQTSQTEIKAKRNSKLKLVK